MGANASRPLVRLGGKSRENDNISLDTSPVPPAYIDDEIDGWMAIEADETTNLADAILPVPELDKAQLRLPNWTDILQSNQSLSTTTTNIDNTSNINDINNNNDNNNENNNNNNNNNNSTEKKRPSSGTISNKHNDWTTMVLCARYGYFESLQMFLSGNFGSIPSHDLWLALLLTCFLGHLSCLDLLLSQPEAILVLNKQTTDNYTPLLYALQQGHILCVERLLKEPTIDITLCDIYGWNALMYASRYGYTSIFSHILTLSPNSSINQQSKNDGWTPLMLAIYGEHEQCAISLLHSDNINITISTYDGIWDALTLAIRLGQTETIQLLLTATSERSTTIVIPSEGSLTLSENSKNNYNKININEIKNDRWTPLMLAARYGHLDCLQLLLTHHECEPDIVLHGYSALLLAYIFHHEQCVKLLLQYSKQSLDYIKTNGQPLTFSDGVVYQEQQQQKQQQQQQQKQKEEEEEEQKQQSTNDVTDGNVAVIKDKNHDFNDNITYNDNIEPPHYNGD